LAGVAIFRGVAEL